MRRADDAVHAIQHVVQDHGDARTRLGCAADPAAVHWFGRLLGWDFPPSYVEVLARHDGVLVQDAIVFGFLESIDIFLLYRELWHRPVGYWPVASDGCGNYFVLALTYRETDGECPVVFIDTIASAEEPAHAVATNYAGFVCGHMREQCERMGCSALDEPTIANGGEV